MLVLEAEIDLEDIVVGEAVTLTVEVKFSWTGLVEDRELEVEEEVSTSLEREGGFADVARGSTTNDPETEPNTKPRTNAYRRTVCGSISR